MCWIYPGFYALCPECEFKKLEPSTFFFALFPEEPNMGGLQCQTCKCHEKVYYWDWLQHQGGPFVAYCMSHREYRLREDITTAGFKPDAQRHAVQAERLPPVQDIKIKPRVRSGAIKNNNDTMQVLFESDLGSPVSPIKEFAWETASDGTPTQDSHDLDEFMDMLERIDEEADEAEHHEAVAMERQGGGETSQPRRSSFRRDRAEPGTRGMFQAWI